MLFVFFYFLPTSYTPPSSSKLTPKLYQLERTTLIPKRGSNQGASTGNIPIIPSRWYEVEMKYACDNYEKPNHSFLLADVKFYAENKELRGYRNVPGLQLGAGGRLYRYVPTGEIHAGQTDKIQKFRFAFCAPKEVDSTEVRILPWKNGADVALLSLTVDSIPEIGGISPKSARRVIDANNNGVASSLKKHLKAAGITHANGNPIRGWVMQDAEVNRWLTYWSKINGNTNTTWQDWLLKDAKEEQIPPANHGVIVGKDFFETMAKGELMLSSFKPYKITSPPDWSANPFSSNSWRQRYQSLYWLAEYAAILPKEKVADNINATLASWHTENSWPWAVDRFAWDDHAIAMRLEGLIHLVRGRKPSPSDTPFQTSCPALPPNQTTDISQQRRIAAQLIIDSILLEEFIDSLKFYAHNHSLFHITALLEVTIAFPKIPAAERWRKKALQRLNNLIDELWLANGASVEQSSSYQAWVLMSALPLYMGLSKGNALPDELKERFRHRIEQALIMAINLLGPQGGYFKFGDAPEYPRAKPELQHLCKYFLPYTTKPELHDFVKTGNPPLGAYIYDNAYAIFRSNVSEERVLIIDISSQAFSHGHYDLGGFVFAGGSNKWIVDAGGPYNYNSPEQIQLASTSSHNVAWPIEAGQIDGYAACELLTSETGHWILKLKSNVYGSAVEHWRFFVIDKKLESVTVRDSFSFLDKPYNLVSAITISPKIRASHNQDIISLIAPDKTQLLFQKHLHTSQTGVLSIGNIMTSPSMGKIIRTQRLRLTVPPNNKNSASIGYVFGFNEKSMENSIQCLEQEISLGNEE